MQELMRTLYWLALEWAGLLLTVFMVLSICVVIGLVKGEWRLVKVHKKDD